MKKIHFEGLTEIRAVAALSVIFHHLELYKSRSGLPSLFNTPLRYFIKHLGQNGVCVFFVLSGFLITYLLLSEKKVKKKVDIKKFYARRILRIWPLYYLIVLISFTAIPFLANSITAFQNETDYYNLITLHQESPSYGTLLLFLLFLPNFALLMRAPVVGASQSWSVGVEEQFYIIWPHIINRVTNKYTMLLLFSIIYLLPEINDLLSIINPTLSNSLHSIIEIFPIHFMAAGAIGAFLLFHFHNSLQKIIMNKYFFMMNTLLIITFLMLDIQFPLKDIVFRAVIILEILFITQNNFRINLRSKFLEEIGEISYGIYMYHPLMMYICFSFFNTTFTIENSIIYNIAIYSSVIITTLIISKLSFKYFENRFISLKNKKYTVI